MAKEFGDSKQMAREFDIIEEMEKTLDEIDRAFEILETDAIPDKVTYLRFLLKDLDEVLSGEHESLRYRKFTLRRGE